jgi:hypothetical protein
MNRSVGSNPTMSVMREYQLKWLHRFVRETQCFFFGHKWVHSRRKRTEWWNGDDSLHGSDVPYGVRKISGNHLFEDIAWWTVKCTRCREKVRRMDSGVSWGYQTWYKRLYHSICYGFFGTTGIVWHLQEVWKDRKKHPLWLTLLGIPLSVNSSLAGSVVHWWITSPGFIPSSWWSWMHEIQHWWYGKLDN